MNCIRQYSSHSIWHKPMGTITVTGSTSVSVCNGWVRSRSLDQHTCRWHLASGVPPDRIQDEARTPRAWAASTSSIPRHRFMDKPRLCNGLALLAGHCPGPSKPGLHGRKQHQLVAYVQGIRQEFAADATQLSIGVQSAFFYVLSSLSIGRKHSSFAKRAGSPYPWVCWIKNYTRAEFQGILNIMRQNFFDTTKNLEQRLVILEILEKMRSHKKTKHWTLILL